MGNDERRDRILSGLQRIRRRRRAIWLSFAAFPLMALAPPPLFGIGALVFFFGFATASVLAGNSRCPRCGRYFFRTWWYHNGFSSKCLHCRLQLDGTNALDYDFDNAPPWPVRAGFEARTLATAAVACGVYSLFAAAILPEWSRYRSLVANGARTSGRVTAKDPANHQSVRYVFTVDGREIAGSGGTNKGGVPPLSQIHVGEEIEVTYLPNTPDISLPGRPDQIYHEWTGLLFVMLPGVSILMGWAAGSSIADGVAAGWERIAPGRRRDAS